MPKLAPRLLARLLLVGAALLAPASGGAASALPDTRHADWRGTPRLQLEPAWPARSSTATASATAARSARATSSG
ncbi:hypothetical protein FJ251_08400 [bacterium]|nr:hypothetical protein [bacterium]